MIRSAFVNIDAENKAVEKEVEENEQDSCGTPPVLLADRKVGGHH